MYREKFNLAGKVAILTGGTGLIGSAFAEGLAECGGNVVVVDIDQAACDDTARTLEDKFGKACIGIGADVASRQDVERVLAKALQKFGKVDILVNCHQNKTANFFASFEEYTEKDWDDILAVNLKGTFLCCQAIGQQMVRQGGGVIINLASTYAVVSPNQEIYEGTMMGCPAAYSASKGGVIALTKYLATYWAPRNVRVNSISPHGVFKDHEERFVKQFSAKSPLGRMSRKEEIVGALIYLASDASSYVTGHNLMVDGGWTTW